MAVLHRENFTTQRRRIRQGDCANAIFGDIDFPNSQFVAALVIDLDRGIATGHFDLAIAGAHQGPRQTHRATRGLDVLQNDQTLVSIEEPIDCHQVLGAKTDALPNITRTVGKVDGTRGRKVWADVQLDGVHTALHQAVDVEIARIDVDGTHGKNDRLASFLETGCQAVIAAVVKRAGRRRSVQACAHIFRPGL